MLPRPSKTLQYVPKTLQDVHKTLHDAPKTLQDAPKTFKCVFPRKFVKPIVFQ
jgi:hypothetical protein